MGLLAENSKGPATLLIDFAIMGVMIFNVGEHM
jgi:amino acid permease